MLHKYPIPCEYCFVPLLFITTSNLAMNESLFNKIFLSILIVLLAIFGLVAILLLGILPLLGR